MLVSSIPLLLAATGCKVVDAPADLESLMVFGFANFDNDDKFLEETADALLPLINEKTEDLRDGYRVLDLTTDDLVQAGVTPSAASDIIGAMGLTDYRHDVDPVIETASAENKDEMWDNFLEYEVLETTDRPCFLEGACPELEQEVHETTNVALLGDAERTYTSAYKRISTDAVPNAVFIRQIAPDEMKFSSNIAVVHQQYSFVMVYQDHQIAKRIEAFWVDAEALGMDLPDTFAIDSAVGQMAEQAGRVDDWIDAHP